MYLFHLSITTTDNAMSSSCYSNPLIVKGASYTLPTYTAGSAPTHILKFNGNYSSIVPEIMQACVYNFASGYGVAMSGMSVYSGSIYVSYYTDTTSTSYLNAIASGGISVSGAGTLTTYTVDGTTYTCTGCTMVVSDTGGASSGSNSVRCSSSELHQI